MKTEIANAFPRKRFFIEMFTRDISLEDCLMDLIDNSIDGLVRNKFIKIDYKNLIKNLDEKKPKIDYFIDIIISEKQFRILDNCGGIEYEYAKSEAFNFGHSDDSKKFKESRLGVYGIGLKRALFKIGNDISIQSRTSNSSFKINFNVNDWIEKDNDIKDWMIPIEKNPKLDIDFGTDIVIKKLNPDIVERINDGTFIESLRRSISKTFMFIIPSGITIRINNEPVSGFNLPVSEIEGGENSAESFTYNKVKVEVQAMFAMPQTQDSKWKMDISGWYVVCNGRVVVFSDKSELTGWGSSTLLPSYQPKYRSFLGIVMFYSDEPENLPWTTTKRSLNKDSSLYIQTKTKMAVIARPIIQYLNKRYSNIEEDEVDYDFSKQLKKSKISKTLTKTNSHFKAPTIKKENDSKINVQFTAEKTDLELIKKHLRKPTISNSKIAEYSLEYLIKQEGLK